MPSNAGMAEQDDPFILPTERLEVIEGWGRASQAAAYVYRPTTIEGVEAVFETARRSGRTVGFRGAGRSYGDAALNAENVVLDLTRFNRIIAWDPASGVITVEPGVTIRQLWEHVVPHGWWPAVVPGTMFPTIGGCAAMNVHGKNNYRVGPIGDHIESFDLLLPTGEVRRCSRDEHADLFHAAIGGFGMLGCFTSLTLRLKRVHSGLLDVTALAARSLAEMIGIFEERSVEADYLVGWIDAFARGRSLGRGIVHDARYLAPGADPDPARTLTVEAQQLPSTILGVFPKRMLWRLMRPLTNNIGIRGVNTAKYAAGRIGIGARFRQSHAAFAFLLDYVPNWRRAYGPGGLIQYQSFIPADRALEAFGRQLDLAREAGLPPYLAVFKRHRRDDFLMTHAVDGYSLALDVRVTASNRAAVWRLTDRLDEIVLANGGRFYFAKDSTLSASAAVQYLGARSLAEFARLKRECDPDGILESNLYRRLFPRSDAGDD